MMGQRRNEQRSKFLTLALVFSLLCSGFPPLAHSQPPARPAMDGPATLQQLHQFREALKKQRETGTPARSSVADPDESYVTDFLTYVWKEPKARYMTASIVVGEVFLATMLWKRMNRNVATWQRQVATVGDVARNMREVTSAYAKAEADLMRSLAAMEKADRAEVLKSVEGLNARTKGLVERALAEGKPARANPGPAPLPLDQATSNLEKTYSELQTKAGAEARVLKAAGRPVTPPAPLSEVATEANARTRAVTRLNYTSGEFQKFKNDGLKALAREARLNLGQGAGWKLRVWRKTRTGLLLAAIPITVVAINHYYDREQERNRRLQNLNSAALQDRDLWLNTLVPYFHRPLLFAVVTAWTKVQGKEGSPLKRFKCPYDLKEAEIDNPHLQIVQSISMQTLIEMEEEGKEVLEENNMRAVIISPEFYKRLIRKILTAENSPLLHLEARVLDPVVDDLANEAFHAFDKQEFAAPVVPVDNIPALPPFTPPDPGK